MPLALAALGPPAGLAEWAAVGGSYLLGSIPFGFVLVWLVAKQDLRRVGSGNIGATNATRVLGKPLGWTAFLLDFAKGWLPVAWLGPAFAAAPERAPLVAVLCGAAAVLGHVFPVWLGFRGGKAVATGLGAVVALDPLMLVLGGGAWLITLSATRYVGLASLAMAGTFPLVAWQRADGGARPWENFWFALFLFVVVLVRHRGNLQRILAGREPKSGRAREGAGGA